MSEYAAFPLGKFDTREDTKLLQKRILAYRREGWSYQNIGDKYNVSWKYIHKLHKKALKEIIIDDVTTHRKEQMEVLLAAQKVAMEAMQRVHLLVSSGHVVRDVQDDEFGNPCLDENKKPILVRLTDPSVNLAAIDKVIKIQERISRLLGLDAPTKTALTNPDGTEEAQFVQFYLPSNERESGKQET